MYSSLTEIAAIFSTWHITRAAGLTAYLLLFMITVCGLLLSMHKVPAKYRPSVVNIHRTAAFACLLSAVVHVVALLLNHHVPFSFADVLLPFWKEDTAGETATGVLAFYAMLLVTITSVSAIMKLLGSKLWRFAHYLAFPCFWFSLYHGLKLGTDSDSPLVTLLYAVTSGIVIMLTWLRIWTIIQKRGFAYEHSTCGR